MREALPALPRRILPCDLLRTCRVVVAALQRQLTDARVLGDRDGETEAFVGGEFARTPLPDLPVGTPREHQDQDREEESKGGLGIHLDDSCDEPERGNERPRHQPQETHQHQVLEKFVEVEMGCRSHGSQYRPPALGRASAGRMVR